MPLSYILGTDFGVIEILYEDKIEWEHYGEYGAIVEAPSWSHSLTSGSLSFDPSKGYYLKNAGYADEKYPDYGEFNFFSLGEIHLVQNRNIV